MTASLQMDANQPVVDEQHTVGRAIGFHLLPGVLIAGLFYALAPAVMAAGYPAIMGGMVAAAVGILGVELGWLLHEGRRVTGRWSVTGALGYRPGKFGWRKVGLVVGLILWQFLAAATVGMKPWMVDNFFYWIPDWAVNPFPSDIASTASATVLLITGAGLLLINVIMGPLVEELYFRGYLLPRLARFGFWAPLINVSLFSLYHFWTPWDVLTRIVILLPLGYAVWKTRDYRVGIAAHVGLSALGFLLNSLPALLGAGS
jgi:membrane protease YdiL (CAAX protease family)